MTFICFYRWTLRNKSIISSLCLSYSGLLTYNSHIYTHTPIYKVYILYAVKGYICSEGVYMQWKGITSIITVSTAAAHTVDTQCYSVYYSITPFFLPAQVSSGTYPGEDREEGEDDGGSGSVSSFIQRVVFLFRNLPLIGQKTEPHEPDQRPECCRDHRSHMVINGTHRCEHKLRGGGVSPDTPMSTMTAFFLSFTLLIWGK